jgi:CubicO group peptidase (beta-lactamase class C family)
VSDQRALPENASLRYLKLEAKRRLAAGEFPTLHASQRAVAREHGQPSWSALKDLIAGPAQPGGRALLQLRWIQGRFRDAAEDGWSKPDDAELLEHFTDQFLAHVTSDRLIAIFTAGAGDLHEELIVAATTEFTAHCRLAGRLVVAATEPSPPYRLAELQLRRLGERLSDPRTSSPPTSAEGTAPDAVAGIAADAIVRLGLPGLSLAGAGWSAATGWADLDRGEPLHPGHAFPVYTITAVVTAVTLLRLVADGRLGLDDPVNRYLTTVTLADDQVTVRQLLTHTGGVTDPGPPFAPVVPDLSALTGPVIACSGRRGVFRFSLAGYAALGEIVADLAGQPYPDAVSRLVLRPLSMTASRFPAEWPTAATADYPAVTGYDITSEGVFAPEPGQVCTFVAGGGLWSTPADLVRFGLGWRSLLPRQLAVQALRPHAAMPTGAHAGLGWIVNEPAGLAGHVGAGPGGGASLIVAVDGGRAHAALTNRLIPIEPVNGSVYQAEGGRYRAEGGPADSAPADARQGASAARETP